VIFLTPFVRGREGWTLIFFPETLWKAISFDFNPFFFLFPVLRSNPSLPKQVEPYEVFSLSRLILSLLLFRPLR